jgi:hypothetical protein
MENEYIVFECPHCKDMILVYINEINCTIFRHGIYKINMQQMNPHETENECNRLKTENLILGCSKPFRLIKNDKNEWSPIICDYI